MKMIEIDTFPADRCLVMVLKSEGRRLVFVRCRKDLVSQIRPHLHELKDALDAGEIRLEDTT